MPPRPTLVTRWSSDGDDNSGRNCALSVSVNGVRGMVVAIATPVHHTVRLLTIAEAREMADALWTIADMAEGKR